MEVRSYRPRPSDGYDTVLRNCDVLYYFNIHLPDRGYTDVSKMVLNTVDFVALIHNNIEVLQWCDECRGAQHKMFLLVYMFQIESGYWDQYS